MEEDGTESQSGILAVHGTSSLVSFTQFVATSGNIFLLCDSDEVFGGAGLIK